jgi:phage terminase large subunit GpA-like protein
MDTAASRHQGGRRPRRLDPRRARSGDRRRRQLWRQENQGRRQAPRGRHLADLKSKFYEYLARQPAVEGSAIVHPPGYCHFGDFLEESYFRQVTAEYLDAEIYRGRTRHRWLPQAGQPNHWFDCRIYNMAVADAYFAAFTADDWANRAKERGIPADLRTPDLFAPKPFQAVALKPVDGATQAGDAPRSIRLPALPNSIVESDPCRR